LNKREIIIFISGLFFGYVIVRVTKSNVNVLTNKPSSFKSLNNSCIEDKTIALGGTTQIKEPQIAETLDIPKVSDCKDKWIDFSRTVKFNSSEQRQKTYDNFMTSCVTQS